MAYRGQPVPSTVVNISQVKISDGKSVDTSAWFVGYLEDENHPYAVAVVLERAGSGGNLAATLAAKALSEAIELVG